MTFANPTYLFLLFLPVLYFIWYLLFHAHMHPKMRVSSTDAYRFLSHTWKHYLLHVPMLLRCLCFSAVVIALARPQTSNSWNQTDVEGIDIMLCMDVSTSMLAEDLTPNRVKAAREVAVEFVSGRPNDNIGLTLFAGEAFTQCPMTTDHAVLINMLQNLQVDMTARGMIEDGTAIGMGLASSVARLKDSKAKSKVIILLTDGSNNRGDISPITAAEIAKSFGIRVYTIGVGTNGLARYPMPVAGGVQYVQLPVEIDSKTLQSIAGKTDGEFYRAQNTQALYNVYKEIDQLERTKLTTKKFSKRQEAFMPFTLLALIALALELLLQNTVLKRIP
ncbi:MAG: VWA domain-containing protein [Bacteroidaceae bacterium]|nr:VWA domain-containing protein [Prevotellaceae bacterium]MDY5631763.1 VWA domain-containing protein [Bacteroidaceae bacterium]